MECAVCGQTSRVVMTRVVAEGTVRRRACVRCERRWYTLQATEQLLPNWRIQWAQNGKAISLRPSGEELAHAVPGAAEPLGDAGLGAA
jgi:hypothetical protein